MSPALPSETVWLWAGLGGYAASAVSAWRGALTGRASERTVFAFLAVGAALFAVAIAARWVRAGYGPFLTMYEILLSNLWSLGTVYAIGYLLVPAARPGAVVALPILSMLGIWATQVSARVAQLPPTYENPWLWVHVAMGKLFLGSCLLATGLAAALLLRRAGVLRPAAQPRPGAAETADSMVWRLLAVAFVFQGFMLIAGSVWAQDAWGRYWSWDPLETWAFVTWIAAAFALHARLAWRMPPWAGWWLILGVFCLAFLTFFGVPFVSQAPHKGAV